MEFIVTRASGSAVVQVKTGTAKTEYTRHLLDALLDEMMALRKEIEATALQAALANPVVKKLMEERRAKEEQLVDLRVKQRLAELGGAPPAKLDQLKGELARARQLFKEADDKLKAAMPGFMVVVVQRPTWAAVSKKVPPAPLSQGVNTAVPDGSPVYRARTALSVRCPRQIRRRRVY